MILSDFCPFYGLRKHDSRIWHVDPSGWKSSEFSWACRLSLYQANFAVLTENYSPTGSIPLWSPGTQVLDNPQTFMKSKASSILLILPAYLKRPVYPFSVVLRCLHFSILDYCCFRFWNKLSKKLFFSNLVYWIYIVLSDGKYYKELKYVKKIRLFGCFKWDGSIILDIFLLIVIWEWLFIKFLRVHQK